MENMVSRKRIVDLLTLGPTFFLVLCVSHLKFCTFLEWENGGGVGGRFWVVVRGGGLVGEGVPMPVLGNCHLSSQSETNDWEVSDCRSWIRTGY